MFWFAGLVYGSFGIGEFNGSHYSPKVVIAIVVGRYIWAESVLTTI